MFFEVGWDGRDGREGREGFLGFFGKLGIVGMFFISNIFIGFCDMYVIVFFLYLCLVELVSYIFFKLFISF